MNKSMYLGRSSEHLITSLLLAEGREVFTPAVDDRGVDLLVASREADGSYQELQVKSISEGGLFAPLNCPNPRPNYWFIFYVQNHNTLWLINSMDLVRIASKNVQGKNVGKYSIPLSTAKKISQKYKEYIIIDFSRLP